MSDWKEIEFANILKDESISYGIVQPGSHIEIDGVPIIRVQNIKNGKIVADDIKKVAKSIEESYLRTRLKGGELLITVVGTVGECAIVNKQFAGWNVARAVSVARIKDEYDTNFIRYCFLTDDIKFQMYGNTNDTVQPTLNLKELKSLKLNIPSLSEQKAISEVLTSLDDKIDLLHRQNKTLEKIAETLYESWIYENNFDSSIKDLINVQNGYAFKSKSFQDTGNHRVLKIKNISGGIVNIQATDFVSNITISNIDNRFIINTGDILFAMTGAKIGKMGIIPKTTNSLWLNQRVGLFKEKYIGARFLAYLHLKSDFGLDYIENTATGSAQPNISGIGIENCEFPKLSVQELKEYSEQLNLLFGKVIFNLGQIHTLEKIRVTLLPKLMNGEIDLLVK